eukprot:UN01799
MGSEASHEPERNNINDNAGYEWWVGKEARKRNPNIILYGLAWRFPHWIETDPGPQKTMDRAAYLTKWVDIGVKTHGLTIDLMGFHNENYWTPEDILNLRKSLDNAGYKTTKIVLSDSGPPPGYQSPQP